MNYTVSDQDFNSVEDEDTAGGVRWGVKREIVTTGVEKQQNTLTSQSWWLLEQLREKPRCFDSVPVKFE